MFTGLSVVHYVTTFYFSESKAITVPCDCIGHCSNICNRCVIHEHEKSRCESEVHNPCSHAALRLRVCILALQSMESLYLHDFGTAITVLLSANEVVYNFLYVARTYL